MREKLQQGFPPIRRVLAIKTRKDGAVRLMRVTMRGDQATSRRNAGLLDDGNAAAVYGRLFMKARFDSICPRVWNGNAWLNPMEVEHAS